MHHSIEPRVFVRQVRMQPYLNLANATEAKEKEKKRKADLYVNMVVCALVPNNGVLAENGRVNPVLIQLLICDPSVLACENQHLSCAFETLASPQVEFLVNLTDTRNTIPQVVIILWGDSVHVTRPQPRKEISDPKNVAVRHVFTPSMSVILQAGLVRVPSTLEHVAPARE